MPSKNNPVTDADDDHMAAMVINVLGRVKEKLEAKSEFKLIGYRRKPDGTAILDPGQAAFVLLKTPDLYEGVYVLKERKSVASSQAS